MSASKTQLSIDEKGRQFGPQLISLFLDPVLEAGKIEPVLTRAEVDMVKIDLSDGEQGAKSRRIIDVPRSIQEGIVTVEEYEGMYSTIQKLVRGSDYVAEAKGGL